MKDDQLRLFIGIPLNDEVRNEIIRETEILKKNVGDVRWVKPQNWHVTVKFLGETAEGAIPEIMGVLEKTSVYLPFEMEIHGVGAFPSLGSARVIWVGAYDESGTVHRIYEDIEAGTKRIGFPCEKRDFNPHVTIGRSRGKPVSLNAGLAENVDCRYKLPVDRVVLFKSELDRDGAVYSIVGSVSAVSRDSA